jgi:hypothetical protein
MVTRRQPGSGTLRTPALNEDASAGDTPETAAHNSLRMTLMAEIANLTHQECDVVKALVDILHKVRLDIPFGDEPVH